MQEPDLVQVRKVGDRLRSAVRGMVDSFPPPARSISGMARYLELHKATCQRVVEGLEHVSDSLESFARLPGTRGLYTLVEAAERKGGAHQEQSRVLRGAIGEYEELLKTHGRTQAGLVKLIDSMRGEQDAPSVVVVRRGSRDRARDRRKALFDAARVLTGEEVQTKSAVGVLYPDPKRPKMLRVAIASTLAGVVRHPFSRPIAPFVVGSTWARLRNGQGSGDAAGIEGEVPTYELLEYFSTTGLKSTKLSEEGGRLALTVDLESRGAMAGMGMRDPKDPTAMGPADVAVLFRTTSKMHPSHDAEAVTDFAVRISQPCKDMVMDMFVHKSIPVKAPGQAWAYSLSAPPGDTTEGCPEVCGHERFPESAPVATMNPMGRGAATKCAYERQDDLIEHIFAAERLSRGEFGWHRVQVAYPMWQTEYRVRYEKV